MPIITKFGGAPATGNALAQDLLSGKTATTAVGEITGTMVNNDSLTITPSATTIWPNPGYYSFLKINGDSNLIASNIKSGTSIFGVNGSYLPGFVYLATDRAGNTATGATLGSLVSVIAITVSSEFMLRNNGGSNTATVQGSSDGGSNWTTLLTVTASAPSDMRAVASTSSSSISGTYNKFRVLSSNVSDYYEYLFHASTTIIYK